MCIIKSVLLMVVTITGDIVDSSSNHVSDCHRNSHQNLIIHEKECNKQGNGNHGEI